MIQREQTDARYDVIGVGAAIVDVIASVSDEELVALDMTKGAMNLVDGDRSAALLNALREPIFASGGSSSNTTVGIASFGGDAAFAGKVADDALGQRFIDELSANGVDMVTKPSTSADSTATSIILVTPDAQRTMNTHLGVASQLSLADVPEGLVGRAETLFLEAYLWDGETTHETATTAIAAAKQAGVRVAFSLADPLCVDRHRSQFLDLLADVDVVFANAEEVSSLYNRDIGPAIDQLAAQVPQAFVTLGVEGSVVIEAATQVAVPIFDLGEAVDTTGAGDQYAAGVLFGLARGYNAEACGLLGALAGAEVVTHQGGRPHQSLKELAEAHQIGDS